MRQVLGADIGFINGCGIDYTIYDPSVGINDSGWCDAETGQRFLTPTMRLTFHTNNNEDVHVLKLKFGEHMCQIQEFLD